MCVFMSRFVVFRVEEVTALHAGDSCRVGVDNVVREVDKELSKAALGGGVVAQNRRECCVSEGLGEALAKSFAGSGVVTESMCRLV